MRYIFTIFMVLATWALAQAQTDITLVKSLDVRGQHQVIIDLPGQVKVSTWDEPFARVTTSIELKNFDESLLKRLVAAGRYNVELQVVDGQPAILMPKVGMPVSIQGKQVQEVFRFELQLPKTCLYDVKSTASL